MPIRACLLQKIASHQGDVLTCCFSGRLLAVGSADKLVRLFALVQEGNSFGELPQSPLCGHSYAVNFVHFTPLGTLLASCSQDGKVIIWDVRTGTKVCKFEHESKASLRVCQFSPDARMLATGSDDETLALWDMSQRKYIRNLEGHEASVVALAFSPDGSYLVSGSPLGDLRFWDARFGQGRHLALVKDAHDLGVTCTQFSPSFGAQGPTPEVGASVGYLLATGGTDNLVKLWRIKMGKDKEADLIIREYTKLEGHNQNVMCICFTPTGHLLASGSGDRTVIVWDPIKGLKLHQLEHHQRYVTCVAFSSDGTLLASGSNDKQVALWRLSEGEGDEEDMTPFTVSPEDEKELGFNEMKPVSDWSMDEVQCWLKHLHLPQYKDHFEKNRIDGQELFHLNDSMLKKSLSIDALGHRNKILRSVKMLREKQDSMSSIPIPANLPGLPVETPHEYYCPITHEVMTDPVIAADGYTYERSAIASWIENGKRTSPMTNAMLPNMDLTPNRMLKMLIQKNVRA